MNRQHVIDAGVALGLVVLGAGSRMIGSEPNFAAVGACALFAGFYFRSAVLAVGVPMAAMLVSDAFIGGYEPRQMVVVYACLAMPVLLRTLLGERPGVTRVLGASALAAVAFFLFTNLAVWAFSRGYTKDAAGLALCFERALPFFRATLVSQLAFGAGLFGLHRLGVTLAARSARRSAAPAAA